MPAKLTGLGGWVSCRCQPPRMGAQTCAGPRLCCRCLGGQSPTAPAQGPGRRAPCLCVLETTDIQGEGVRPTPQAGGAELGLTHVSGFLENLGSFSRFFCIWGSLIRRSTSGQTERRPDQAQVSVGPGRCPPASAIAGGTARGTDDKENERKGTGHAVRGLPHGWACPAEPRSRWNTCSGPRGHQHEGPVTSGGPSPAGGGEVTVGPGTPPQGHSIHTEETGLFTVGFGPVAPCQAEPAPRSQLFPGRLSLPVTCGHGRGERRPHTDQRGSQNPQFWLEPPPQPVLSSHPQ